MQPGVSHRQGCSTTDPHPWPPDLHLVAGMRGWEVSKKCTWDHAWENSVSIKACRLSIWFPRDMLLSGPTVWGATWGRATSGRSTWEAVLCQGSNSQTQSFELLPWPPVYIPNAEFLQYILPFYPVCRCSANSNSLANVCFAFSVRKYFNWKIMG